MSDSENQEAPVLRTGEEVTKCKGKIDKVKTTGLWWEDDVVVVGNGKPLIFHKTLGKARVQRPHSFRKGQEVEVIVENGILKSLDNGIETGSG